MSSLEVSGIRVGVTFNCEKAVTPYCTALRSLGIEPVPLLRRADVLENPDKLVSLLDDVDGLLLSGGIDVNCKLYKQSKHPKADAYDDVRDAFEFNLASEALVRDIPVLGICRGMQLLNVVCGGTLIQHLDNVHIHQVRPADLWTVAHDVTVSTESKLFELLQQERFGVNSRHHQAVDSLGAGLRVCARAVPDSVIEAIEMPSARFVVGVQWHPENGVQRDPVQTQLFKSFRAAMAS